MGRPKPTNKSADHHKQDQRNPSQHSPAQRKVWDAIASGWSDWRVKPRREIDKFAHDWWPSRILDIGCGNGRNLLPFSERGFDCYGIDFSKQMVGNAEELFKRRGLVAKFNVADARKLPFRSGNFDYCVSIAVLHHLKGVKEQMRALQEMKRVLRKGGIALVTVWNKYSFRYPHMALKPKETYISWNRKGTAHQRYYYLFSYWELKRLLHSAGFRVLKSGGLFDENIVFLVEKA